MGIFCVSKNTEKAVIARIALAFVAIYVFAFLMDCHDSTLSHGISQ
ncbi:hypothetical protein [Helicobacter sp. MIT 01-3238]|nr:hypothetical protein [Helicobacter sp. MIT 01-3238]